jgi:hypothetical protein
MIGHLHSFERHLSYSSGLREAENSASQKCGHGLLQIGNLGGEFDQFSHA